MAALMLIALISMSLVINSYTTEMRDVDLRIYERMQYGQTVTIAQGVQAFLEETGAFPASLPALAATPGYEYIGKLIEPNVGYVVATDIEGTRWRFDRAIIFIQDPLRAVPVANYINANTCGVGANDPAGFCGSEDSWYVVLESKDLQTRAFRETGLALDDTLYRILKGYDNGLPTVRSNGTSLSTNEADYLIDIVGYTGTANDCVGSFMFEGAVLTCADLFSIEGNPVSYYYVGPNEGYVGVAINMLEAIGTGDAQYIFRGM